MRICATIAATIICGVSIANAGTSECLSSIELVKATHTKPHASWSGHVPGHRGVMCYFDKNNSPLKPKVLTAEKPKPPVDHVASIAKAVHEVVTQERQLPPAVAMGQIAMELRGKRALNENLKVWWAIFDATCGHDTHWAYTSNDHVTDAFRLFQGSEHVNMIVTINPRRVVPAVAGVDHEATFIQASSGSTAHVASAEGRP